MTLDTPHGKWEVQEEKRKEVLRLQKIEVKRREYLFELAQDYQKAELIRNLIQAFSGVENKEEGFEGWLVWATGVVNSLSVTGRQAEIVSQHESIAKKHYYF